MAEEDRFSAILDQLLRAFARFTVQDLERSWAWKDYTDDGLRFAFFRTYEELVQLRTHLRSERARLGIQLSKAGRYLGEYHRGFRDLEAMLYGCSNEQAEFEPEPGEWSIRRTLGHILTADLGFLVVVKLALKAADRGEAPSKPEESDWDRIVDISDEDYDALMQAPLDEMWSSYASWHARILDELAGISDAQLGAPSRYWEQQAYSIEFRLLRFSSHLFQHSVQIEKTLQAVIGPPSEAGRLVRKIARVRADIETTRLGSPELGAERIDELAEVLEDRSQEIAAIIGA